MDDHPSDVGFLSGPSAYVLYAKASRWIWAFVGTALVLMVLAAARVPQSLFNVFLALLFPSLVPWVAFVLWGSARTQSECTAGYTTLPRKFKELEQRDPYLGERIRDAGEEFIADEEFLSICSSSKALATRFGELG
ncbi:hypothetical protein [Arthrobacter woluwensis]|uniref:Uncharacterized protein n=1 Tax=Arthrobacter woluwensis TaxID=156980 RepID=A0A1H4L991_9MICC|nr:hypothetical protein [Arthrobacter woluwensis]SEB67253.1 hypothetical protein SAMN04489745_0924 [Arthrobacter woluwensis]